MELSFYEQKLIDEYGDERFNRMKKASQMPKDIEYERSTVDFAQNKNPKEIEQAVQDDRAKDAKVWLEKEELACFAERGRTRAESLSREWLVVKLKKDEGLTFTRMGQLLSELTGKKIKKAGLQYIYHHARGKKRK